MSRRVPKKARRQNLVSLEHLEDREVPAVAVALSGTNLLTFDTASPAVVQTTAITGVNGSETLAGIDFRPQNGVLYGLGVNATTDTATLYAISTRTGAATPVGATGAVAFTTDGVTKVDLPDPTTTGYGFDFNPAADRVRVVAGGLNFRVNPNTGTGIDGDNGGGATTGVNPDGAISGLTTTVDDAAYTNDQPNNSGITTLYTLDSASNSLYVQNPPNSGTQTLVLPITLGGNPLDFTGTNGFDIPAGVNATASNLPVTVGSAFAVLNVGGTTGLYSINLVNGQATLLGNVGTGAAAVQGVAIQNDLGGFPAIALSADGTSLIRFNTTTPGTTATQALNTAALVTGETLVGIDFRPATGQLYGLGIDKTAETGTLYLIDPQTGALTTVGAGSQISFTSGGNPVDFPDPATAGYGFDFNPDVDRIRVVTSTGLNFRVNPSTGAPVDADAVTAGTQPDGTVNGGGATGASAAAYTNSFGNDVAVTATTLYTLDAATDKLFIQNPPNNGTQTNGLAVTLGGAPLDFTAVNGFDIPAGVRVATSNAAVTSGFGYAALTVGGVTGVYRINLVTGEATSLGNLGAGATQAAGFTLADAPAGTVSFAGATSSVSEGIGTATVMLNRTGGTSGELTVTVNVTGGTATAGFDFTGGPYTVTFADGATSATLSIPITEDTTFEGNETIALTIASASNGAAVGSPNVHTLTITENDAQQTFAVTDAQGFALGAGGTTLIPFSTLNPGAALTPITITGVNGSEQLVAIDYRPINGLLYGLGVNATADTATLYLISPKAGVATPVGTVGGIAFTTNGTTPVDLPDPVTVRYDIDFNPAVDRVRVVAGSLNFRVNPNNGTPVDGNNGSASAVSGTNPDGAINGQTTTVQGTAYANNYANNGAVTTQFALDPTTDKLFIQNPPNNGTQTAGLGITVGGAPLDFTAVKGFDILAGVNVAANNAAPTAGSGLAVLTVGGVDTLYRIDLTTGAATSLGTIGATPATVTGLALQSDLGLTPVITLVAGQNLLQRVNSPATGAFPVPVTGLAANETLVGIDVRPATGQLYGLGVNAAADKGTVYVLDPLTGAATAVGATGLVAFVQADGSTAVDLPDPATAGYGFDFNPSKDAIRVTTSTGLNFRVNATTGAPVDGNLNQTPAPPGVNPDGPVNGLPGGSTGVSAAAYTNSYGGAPFTTLYTLDATSDSLFIQTSPNGGTQGGQVAVTLGGAALDFTDVNGFDIPAAVGETVANGAVAGRGYAVLTVGGKSHLYAIDLTTGEATDLGGVAGVTAPLSGLALAATPAGTISFSAATFSQSESKATADLTLTRTGGTTGPVTVTVTLAGGTATAGDDFTATPLTVTFADGATTATASVPITADTTFEPDETFTATLTNPTNGAVLGATTAATVTITNDDPAPTVSVGSLSITEGNAGTTGFTFTVTLSNPSSQAVTLNVNTADGTAKAGSDYTAVTGQTLTFAPGETSKTVTVNVTGDTVNEADETFALVLSVTGPGGETTVATGTGTILNDDAAPVLTVSSAAAFEGNAGTTPLVFTVTLTGATEQTVTVDVATANNTATAGSDFVGLGGQTLVFAPGDTTKTVTVTVNGDTTVENDETFFLVLSNPTNATIAAGAKGVGTILNDDAIPTAKNQLLTGGPVTAIGADSGPPTVRVIAADGTQLSTFAAFATSVTGGVRTATADVNGDGTPDVIAGTGPGVTTQVRVFDGATGKELFSVQPFEASFTGGVYVAAGDVTGDGTPDVLISPDQGGGPRVDVYSGKGFTKVDSFFGIDDPNFRGGARIAVGDVNGDGVGDLVVAAGFQGGPRVAAFDGTSIGKATKVKLFNDFFAFEQTLRNGVFIAVGDVDGDGKADIIAGGGPGGGPRVTVFGGADLIASGGATQTVLANFFAGDTANRLGVQVAVKNVDGDNKADLRTVVGGSDQVVTYLGKDLTPTGTPPGTTLDGLPDYNGGVFVG